MIEDLEEYLNEIGLAPYEIAKIIGRALAIEESAYDRGYEEAFKTWAE